MVTILWSFQTDPARIAEFEQAYGPDGDWARLFRRGAGFLGTAAKEKGQFRRLGRHG